jgi:cytochrome c biogenesis protein CcmG/thiol:disulfide interchange protein DsbE
MHAQATIQARTGSRTGARGTLVIMAITAAIILGVAYLSDRRDTIAADGAVTAVTVVGSASGAAPVIDTAAPDFAALTTDGTPFKLSDYVGRPVWLTFGASWCQPCRAENPDIQATYRKVGDDIVVLQVYMSEDAATVKEYVQRVGITYTTVPDPSERLAAEYRILGIPSHFFIDASGVLRQIKIGSLDPASMEAALAGLRE